MVSRTGAAVGNLPGGLMCGFLMKRGYAVTDARKASATFFAALMPSAIPAVLVSDVRLSIGLISIANCRVRGQTML